MRNKGGDHLLHDRKKHTMYLRFLFFVKIWSIQVVDNWVIFYVKVMYGKYLYAIIVAM